jgi:hypothetical protein
MVLTSSELNRMIDLLFMARKFWPYCLEQRTDGKYILLNRDYKPVGFIAEDEWADYEIWPIAFQLNISPEQAAAMSHNGDDYTGRIYFYNDGCKPWERPEHDKAYRRRLAMFFLLEGARKCRSARMPSPSVVDHFRYGGIRQPIAPQSQN